MVVVSLKMVHMLQIDLVKVQLTENCFRIGMSVQRSLQSTALQAI